MSATTPELVFRQLLTALPGGVALFDEDGGLLEANAAFLRLVGPAGATPFARIFKAPPEAFVDHADPVLLGDRHLVVVATLQPTLGWLVQAQDVTALVSRNAAAAEAAVRDALTGLSNRAHVLPELERLGRLRDGSAAVLMIDLDRFKAVNDTLGHGVGDQLLVKVAERLRTAVRPEDLLARLGGDEFVVLQAGGAQPAAAEALAKRLVELLGRPYLVDGHMVDIGASVGITLAHGDAPGQWLKQADIALYRAKEAGRGCYTFFEQRMDDEMQERRTLEIALRRALAFREFALHYQPQLDLATRQVTGLEALIRWRHPQRGLVAPPGFIPLAEETGLIVPIGEWVIRQACEDAAGWKGELAVAVNLSAKQLVTGNLVKTVADALAHARLAPERLEIEITETVLMTDCAGTVDTLHALRALGVKVSMDDFGTGYSSLSYLSSFPFDKIKIDQSFVRANDPGKADGIIRAITAIGGHLGMATIAEGVETQAQLDALEATGCGAVQGFLLSKAVPAEEVGALVARLAAEPFGMPAEPRLRVPMPTPSAPAEANLYRLVYYSRNMILGLDEEVVSEVGSILRASQRNNAAAGVTGALMFTDGLFAQVLEGGREAVEQVFERIQRDERHAEVQLLAFEPVTARLFASWSMAFIGTDGAGLAKFGHYAASSGFDFAATDADRMCGHLRALLVDEEARAIAA